MARVNCGTTGHAVSVAGVDSGTTGHAISVARVNCGTTGHAVYVAGVDSGTTGHAISVARVNCGDYGTRNLCGPCCEWDHGTPGLWPVLPVGPRDKQSLWAGVDSGTTGEAASVATERPGSATFPLLPTHCMILIFTYS